MLRTAMGYLSAADHGAMAAEGQAECLLALEEMTAVTTAGPPWRGTRTGPRCCTATDPRPAPGNNPGSEIPRGREKGASEPAQL